MQGMNNITFDVLVMLHRCKTWCPTVREKQTDEAWKEEGEDKGSKRGKGQLSNKAYQNLYTLPNSTRALN
jgi:hypothetical protein